MTFVYCRDKSCECCEYDGCRDKPDSGIEDGSGQRDGSICDDVSSSDKSFFPLPGSDDVKAVECGRDEDGDSSVYADVVSYPFVCGANLIVDDAADDEDESQRDYWSEFPVSDVKDGCDYENKNENELD